MSILQSIHGHEDLARLNLEQRQSLCREIRTFLVDSISKTGGHLASNLGVVEISVALETVYDTNIDRLVFDVGHQSYVHKLLTGRQADFARLRQFGGMAGFPKPAESTTDAFVAGHASSSVSVALGMARARTISRENYHVVALVGDGAATGGMIYEALNDAAVSKEPMVIILNDNEMSIAPNVGGLARHLSRLRTRDSYLGMKRRYRQAMSATGFLQKIYIFTRKIKNWVKHMVLPTTIFENMGLQYLGPVDGNDLEGMISLLRQAKTFPAPVVIHVHTKKGKGYRYAEEDPSRFHGVGKFDVETGVSAAPKRCTFSANFGQTMLTLAAQEPKLCAITAAMPEGTGLGGFLKCYPERTFDVGIAEEHALSMAGGLAKQGMIPVVALYSTFLQRSYDQIMQDIAILHQHVVLAIDRAGLVGEDGETHHGVFDVGFLRQIPGMMILAPISLSEQAAMLSWAVKKYNGPVAIRYPRGGNGAYTANDWEVSKPVKCHRHGGNTVLVTYGLITNNVLDAAEILHSKGIETTVLRLLCVEPLPVKAILPYVQEASAVIVVEDVCTGSGIKEALAWQLRKYRKDCFVSGIDLGKQFVPHGDMASLYRHCGVDAQSIAKHVQEVLA